jgi:formylmethanofuran dehydrogenase subunit E
MINNNIVKLAIDLHGHLAPGIALGLRMSEIALIRLGVEKGNKYLVGISETARCLADAMQAATGCTLGHGNAFVEDYGKLALTIGDMRTGRGVRVALREDANEFTPLMNKWMMRLGKLTHPEEDELGNQLLEMDEKYLLVEDVKINKTHNFEKSVIVKCSKCGGLIPQGLTVLKEDIVICKACDGELYYRFVNE